MSPFLLVVPFLFLAAVAVFWYAREKRRAALAASLKLKLFLVRFPRASAEGRDLKAEINLSEQLFAALAAFKEPFVFEVAVPVIGEEIHFYAAVPDRFEAAFARQVQAIWNEAQIDPAEDYTVFNYAGKAAGAWVAQKKRFILPIRTYDELGADTFGPLVGGLVKTNVLGEGAALQFVFRPAKQDAKRQIASALTALKKGAKLKEVLDHSFSFSDFSKAVSGKGNKDEERVVDESAVKALERKIGKPLFEVNVRAIASAPDQAQADALLNGLTAGFSQFAAPERNELSVTRPRDMRDFVHALSFREFDPARAMVLSSEECVSIFHFPTPMTAIPQIKELKFKEVPPPADLPAEGVTIGESVFRGVRRAVRIGREDRRRHVYVVGQTGTGKSVFLNDVAGQDIRNGEGVCVIDPNGDLFEDVLSSIPKERVRDVIVFDPSDLSRPLGLNMLEYDPRYPEQKTFLINEMMTIFDTLYDLKATGGPMFEQYTRNALLLLMDDPADGYTILEIPRVLSDAAFRRRLLAKCKNVITKDFWEREAEKAGGEAALVNLVPYITSKFNTFIANDYVRPVIAQSRSTLKFREVMDQGKILLVNLSKGRIGELNASLLGMILVGKLTMAAFSRTDVPQDARRDFYLFIDEFQNFTTPSIATILSEARKYRLCLTIAHQFIGQLSEEIRNAVFGNVGSLVAFRVGAEDAEFLVKQFEPVFTQNNLINIDNLNAHVKLLVRSQVASPFNMFVPFPPKGDPKVGALARDFSRLTYGRDREVVEQEIYGRLKGERGTDPTDAANQPLVA